MTQVPAAEAEPENDDPFLTCLKRAPKDATAHELVSFVEEQRKILVASYAESEKLAKETGVSTLFSQPPSKDDLLRILIEGECAPMWQQIQIEACALTTRVMGGAKPLPAIENAEARLAFHVDAVKPVQLVEGMLNVGERLLLSGASKSCKSWAALDLAVSVSNGIDFWGLPTKEGRVLYINYELGDYFFDDRLEAIVKARKAHAGNIDVLPLQRHWGNFEIVRDYIITKLMEAKRDGDPYSLVIIDPLYSLLEGKNENDNSEMAKLMSDIGNIAIETGSAVAMIHHFAKGNSSVKSSIDRSSGAGVFARYPDCLVTLDRHQDDDGRVAEFTFRNLPDLEPIGLRWEYPLLVLDEEIDTDKLQGRSNGNEALATLTDFVAAAHELGNAGEQIELAVLFKKMKDTFKYKSDSPLYDFRKEAVESGKLNRSKRGWLSIPPEPEAKK